MLSINHIISVLSIEMQTYSAGTFLSTIFYVWIAYFMTSSIEKIGFKIFWFIYAVLHLYEILQSSSILYNPFMYFALTVLLLQLNFHKLVKMILRGLQERARNKYYQCKARNMYYDSVEEKIRREEEIARTQDLKNKQQKNFLDKLSNKLDDKLKFLGK
jgi:hypothetical protein